MGYLKAGKWIEQSVNPETEDGEFHRQKQEFRDWIGDKDFNAEKGRYHLYVSLACPWAHRTLIMRKLKKLEDVLEVSVVHPHMLDKGWSFANDFPRATGDRVHNLDFLKDLYVQVKSDFTGRVTVPILYDKKTDAIVNNESAEILRILNSSFNEFTDAKEDYYPKKLQEEIDQINEDVYHNFNNGVYKTGFARKQEAYEKNYKALFECVERLEAHLTGRNFLVGETLTEADIRLYTTLVRFDAVYHVHFKCNKQKISEYPTLQRYLCKLYNMEAFKSTTDFNHIKQHYYYSHESLNPMRIVPLGPELKLNNGA